MKFNQKFDAVSPQTGKEVRTRYPVVVAFHKEEELVEIRFDTLRTIFIDTQDVFYVHLISTVVNYSLPYGWKQYAARKTAAAIARQRNTAACRL